MRKWYVPLTVAGIGGLGALLFSEPGQRLLRWLGRYLEKNSESMLEWNETAEAELQRLQAALAALTDSLQPQAEPGR
jgi:hypothetical protein